MARDVEYWKDDGAFKLRSSGLIKCKDKYLVVFEDYFKYWQCPGGRVALGEGSDKAVIREVFEETGIKTKIEKFLANYQFLMTLDNGNPFHEIDYFYLLSPIEEIDTNNYFYDEIANGKIKRHNCKWVTLEELEKIDFRPAGLCKILRENLDNQFFIQTEYK